jgi:hypothetical protein
MRYEQEKKDMEELRALQKKREELRVKLKEAEARYDLAMVADLKCAPAPHAETWALRPVLVQGALLCRRRVASQRVSQYAAK